MAKQRDENPQDAFFKYRTVLNTSLFWAYAHITPLVILLRQPGTIGIRYYGLHVFWGFVWIPMFGVFVAANTGEDLAAMLGFWALYLVLLAVHRFQSYRSFNQGLVGHSRYTGFPWLTRWASGQDEFIAKKSTEPIFCVILGFCLMPFSYFLAGYFLFGAFLLPIPVWLDERRVIVQKMDWQDNVIDNSEFTRWSRDQQHLFDER